MLMLSQLEAAVINGRTCEYRAAVGLRRTKNPVRLAKSMLSSSGLCFLTGSAADDLAAKNGLEMVENSYFTAPKRKNYWDANVARVEAAAESHGTVGAAALDVYGNIAAANSTGGTMFKSTGRVGDTAIIGAGIYADDEVAIVWYDISSIVALIMSAYTECSSGSGEAILKATVASRAASNMSKGNCLHEAVKASVLRSAQFFPMSSCGVIAVDQKGDISIHCNSRIFAVASAGSHVPTRAGVIRSTIPLLRQHVFFVDHSIMVGLAKYPTMPYQATAQLIGNIAVASLSLESFVRVFSKIRTTAKVLKQISGSEDCGLVFSTSSEAHIYTFISSPTSAQCDTESVSDIAEQLDDHFGAAVSISPDDEDALVRIQVVPRDETSIVDFSTLPPKAFLTLTTLLWEGIQVLVNKHSRGPDSLRLKLEPRSGTSFSASVFHSDSSLETALEDPSPVPFHSEYVGCLDTGLGLRARNLEELPGVAQELMLLMKDAIEQEDVVRGL
jgi:isoaspartyl peptidase/L-asparaginase-like protein (Ntn-hydrolase superfamily)